jgi:hypothetical protein
MTILLQNSGGVFGAWMTDPTNRLSDKPPKTWMNRRLATPTLTFGPIPNPVSHFPFPKALVRLFKTSAN